MQEPERDFYEDMFCNFTGGDMDDEENVRTYGTGRTACGLNGTKITAGGGCTPANMSRWLWLKF